MRIALTGNPNSGKTTMYNALTGRNERIGNWAGVTVEKKESPITISQKRYLNDLIKYHRIETDAVPEKLTKSEASRMIDNIISRYGKIKR